MCGRRYPQRIPHSSIWGTPNLQVSSLPLTTKLVNKALRGKRGQRDSNQPSHSGECPTRKAHFHRQHRKPIPTTWHNRFYILKFEQSLIIDHMKITISKEKKQGQQIELILLSK